MYNLNLDSKQILKIMSHSLFVADVDLDKLAAKIRANNPEDKYVDISANLVSLISNSSLLDNTLNFVNRLYSYIHLTNLNEEKELNQELEIKNNPHKHLDKDVCEAESILLYYIQYFKDVKKEQEESLEKTLMANKNASLKFIKTAHNTIAEKTDFIYREMQKRKVNEKQVLAAMNEMLKIKIQVNIVDEKLKYSKHLYEFAYSSK